MTTSWGRADLHVHTTASDGLSEPAAVLAAAQRAGLHAIAVTDHDTIEGALAAQRLAAAYGVEVIVGEEVSTQEGHLLALFIHERVAPGRPMADSIAEVRAQGGLCIAAHPCDWLVPSVGEQLRDRYLADWPLDGLESFNGSAPLPGINRRAARMAAETGLAAVGGSDSHDATTVGAGLTLFAGRTAADLRAAILARATVAEGRGWGLAPSLRYLLRMAERDLSSALRPRGAATSSTR